VPEFSPDVYDYELRIVDPGVKRIWLGMWLDLSYYRILHMPSLTVNDKPFEYSAVQSNNSIEVELGSGATPVDTTLRIRVADPTGAAALFGRPNRHEYTVRVMQPPQLELVTRPKNITVMAPNGQVLESTPKIDYEHLARRYIYTIDEFDTVDVTVACSEFATALKFDGVNEHRFDGFDATTPRTASYRFQLARERQSFVVQCVYKDTFLTNETGNLYTITLHELFDLSNLVITLLLEGAHGYCTMLNLKMGDGQVQKGFECWTSIRTPIFIAILQGPLEYKPYQDITLVNDEGGEYRMRSGVPLPMDIPTAPTTFWLRVYGDRRPREFPVRVNYAAPCQSMVCPGDSAPKPDIQLKEETMKRLCFGMSCTSRDVPHCCGNVAKCDTLGRLCPSGESPSSNAYCEGTACQDSDMGGCCADGPSKCNSAPELCAFGHRLKTNASDIQCSERPCSIFDAGACCETCESYDLGCNMANSTFSKCPACWRARKPMACCAEEVARQEQARKAEQWLELERLRQIARLAHFEQVGCYPEVKSVCNNRTCFYDETCIDRPPRLGGLGCWAGRHDIRCRYCGFDDYEACPQDAACFDGLCQLWSREKAQRCFDAYHVTCMKVRPDGRATFRSLDDGVAAASRRAPSLQSRFGEVAAGGSAARYSARDLLCAAGFAFLAAALVGFFMRTRWRRRDAADFEARNLMCSEQMESELFEEL